jgi:uncharacterized protein YjbI with pentapeptide repeats
MIDHNKIKAAIDGYFENTPTAKIIENLDCHAIDRKKDLDRENIDRTSKSNKGLIFEKLVRFEEVSPANRDAAFITLIESLATPLSLPLSLRYIITPPTIEYPKLKNVSYILEAINKFGLNRTESKCIDEILDLSDADLCSANFFRANLNGFILSGANLVNADLSDAHIINADLSGANLNGANLINADLSDAYLINANLSDTYLISANLSNANLNNVNLRRADLRGANLNGTNLEGADVRNTRFEASLGVSDFMKQDLIKRGAIFLKL